MHEVLVNRLGGLILPRKSVVRLTDRPDMTLDVYRGRKTTIQQQQQQVSNKFIETMSKTFGMFTQVSDTGPHDSLVEKYGKLTLKCSNCPILSRKLFMF